MRTVLNKRNCPGKFWSAIIIILLFISASGLGVARAAWQNPGQNPGQKPEVNNITRFPEWNNYPVLFEGPKGWWKTQRAESMIKDSKVMVVSDPVDEYFFFSMRYDVLAPLNWGVYAELANHKYRKNTLIKQGKRYLLALYGDDCKRNHVKGQCAYVTQEQKDDLKYVLVKFLYDDLKNGKDRFFAEWLSDGLVGAGVAGLADRGCNTIAKNYASEQKFKAQNEKIRAEQARKQAEKERKKAESEKKWRDEQARLKAESEREEREAEARWQKEKQEQLQRDAALRAKLKSGAEPVDTTYKYAVLNQASDDDRYQAGPPSDGPAQDGNKYFDWECLKITKRGNYYVCWSAYSAKGFAFTNMKHLQNGPILENGFVQVVGRYDHNLTIELVNGEEVMIPVLTDVFVKAGR